MKGPARLAEFTGDGLLTASENEAGQTVLTGLWQPDDPERAYDELHRLYMAREKLVYRGPVKLEESAPVAERELEVFILEWSNEEHPAQLKLQEATDIPA